MSAEQNFSQRLRRLEDILARRSTSERRPDEELGGTTWHLSRIPFERIDALTAELRQRAGFENDETDALTARLLLNDYVSALTHLRAVAQAADARLADAAGEMGESRKLLRREREMSEKRAARLAYVKPAG